MLKCFHAITFEYNSEKISLIAAYIYTGIFTVLVPIYTIFIAPFIEIFREYDKVLWKQYSEAILAILAFAVAIFLINHGKKQ